MKRLNSHKYNVLLVKDDVGRAKQSTRNIPNESHTFGKAERRDPEDAGKGKLTITKFCAESLSCVCANVLYVCFISHFDLAILSWECSLSPRQRLQEAQQVSPGQPCHHSSPTVPASSAIRHPHQTPILSQRLCPEKSSENLWWKHVSTEIRRNRPSKSKEACTTHDYPIGSEWKLYIRSSSAPKHPNQGCDWKLLRRDRKLWTLIEGDQHPWIWWKLQNVNAQPT